MEVTKKEQLKIELKQVGEQINNARRNNLPAAKLRSKFAKLSREYKRYWVAERATI